jgi:nucleotide-binding universal stress UspA family protein
MSIRRRVLVPILVLAAACAGGSKQGPLKGSNVISRSELDAAGSVTAYDAIQRLRPNFLRDRGPVSLVNVSARPQAVVFVDQTEYGTLESLRTFAASRLEEVRFFPGAEAATRFGSVYGSGVIQIKLRSE